MSPYYADDMVTLYHGDCREITAWLDADVLVTDPPYGINWSRGAGAGRSKQPGKRIVGDRDTSVREAALTAWGTRPALVFGSVDAPYPTGWVRMLVWHKPEWSGLIGRRVPWWRDWEPVFVVGDWPRVNPSRSSVIRTASLSAGGWNGYATRYGHPHTKPLDVMEQLVDACPPGAIADPFAGSGSTLVAARNLGRRAIGIEIEERYCETAARRLTQQPLPLEAP